jgi:hypothetical protein
MLDIARQDSQQLVVSKAAGHSHGPGVVTVRILVLDQRKQPLRLTTSWKGRDLKTREDVGHGHSRHWIRHAGDASAAGEASTGAPADVPEWAALGHPTEAKIYRHGFSFTRAQAKASGIFDVALRVFRAADAEGVSPAVAADRLAEERMRSVGRLATIRLPR